MQVRERRRHRKGRVEARDLVVPQVEVLEGRPLDVGTAAGGGERLGYVLVAATDWVRGVAQQHG